jgi:hypothetical protein
MHMTTKRGVQNTDFSVDYKSPDLFVTEISPWSTGCKRVAKFATSFQDKVVNVRCWDIHCQGYKRNPTADSWNPQNACQSLICRLWLFPVLPATGKDEQLRMQLYFQWPPVRLYKRSKKAWMLSRIVLLKRTLYQHTLVADRSFWNRVTLTAQ